MAVIQQQQQQPNQHWRYLIYFLGTTLTLWYLTRYPTTPPSLTTTNTIKPHPHTHTRGTPLTYEYDRYTYFTVKLKEELDLLALGTQLGVEYHGPVGELKDYHVYRKPKPVVTPHHLPSEVDSVLDRFHNPPQHSRWHRLFRRQPPSLTDRVHTIKVETPYLRSKRALDLRSSPAALPTVNYQRFNKLGIHDPGFPEQWHFHNVEGSRHDLNVTGLWEEGITGKGVVIAIVDDGIDYEHDDIRDNYYAEGSYDFNRNKKNPYPDTTLDTHGTRCAGQVAGIRNKACGVGIAYEAKVAGIRILSLPISEAPEAEAINYKFHDNHVYSCSWGPPDNGLAMDRPPLIVEDAIKNGALNGRHGKGTVFVFASGNGGLKGDNCNFDGYTNSIYSITVGAIDHQDNHPGYSEACTALMVSAYSSGATHRIYTSSSWDNDCTDDHGGTSAAAPMVAGIIALALQVRPDLTWRDFQHISVQSAVPVKSRDPSWGRTYSGRPYSSAFGYGRVDGYRFVHHAMNFTSVGPQIHLELPTVQVHKKIPQNLHGVSSKLQVTPQQLKKADLIRLEHVTVSVVITHADRSDLAVDLISPNGIVSSLIVPRVDDHTKDGFPGWITMTVKHWDEPPAGTWTLKVVDVQNYATGGDFISWNMTLWGETTSTTTTPVQPPTLPSTTSQVVASPPAKSSPVVIPPPSTTTSPVAIPPPPTSHAPNPPSSVAAPSPLPEATGINPGQAHPQQPGVDQTQADLDEAKSELIKAATSYPPSFFVFFLFSFLASILFLVGATALYRYRTRHARHHQMQELSLLSADHEYALEDLEEAGSDPSPSRSPSSGPYHDRNPSRQPEPPSQLLFEADDPLLLDDSDTSDHSHPPSVLDHELIGDDVSDVDPSHP